jgi:hypothetical protein
MDMQVFENRIFLSADNAQMLKINTLAQPDHAIYFPSYCYENKMIID